MSSGTRTRRLPKALIFGVGVIAVLQAVAGMGAAVIVTDRIVQSEVTLTVGARLVSVKPTPAAGSLEGRSGQDLPLGSEVSTNEAGRGEVDYRDGSLVRLAPNTKFSVVSLTKNAGQRQVRSRLDVGGTWHRVQKLTGSGSYVVETPVATASVRGTTFLVSCTGDSCVFAVFEGTVDVTPKAPPASPLAVTAGQQLNVGRDPVAGGPRSIDAQVLTDPFARENLATDGLPTPTPTPTTGSAGSVYDGPPACELMTKADANAITGRTDFSDGDPSLTSTPDPSESQCGVDNASLEYSFALYVTRRADQIARFDRDKTSYQGADEAGIGERAWFTTNLSSSGGSFLVLVHGTKFQITWLKPITKDQGRAMAKMIASRL